MKRKQKEPMTKERFWWSFFPKLMIIVSAVAYVIGGGILFALNNPAWEQWIRTWCVIEIAFVAIMVLWIEIGKWYHRYKAKKSE